jgi:hypothetical protein
MIFAARLSKAFITPDEVAELERWTGRGILEALIGIDLPADVGRSYSFYAITDWRINTTCSGVTKKQEASGNRSREGDQDVLEWASSMVLVPIVSDIDEE